MHNAELMRDFPNYNLSDPGIPGDDDFFGAAMLLRWLKSPVGSAQYYYNKYGEICWGKFMGRKVIVMLGPDANEFILQNREKAFSNFYAWEWAIGSYFQHGLMLRDFDEHLLHRRVMQQAFHKDALERYIGLMTPQIMQIVDQWVPHKTAPKRVLMFPTLKQLTLDVACNVFLGERAGDQASAINTAFLDLVQASGPGAIVRRPIPGTLAWKGMRARKYLEEYFRSTIAIKRREKTADFYSVLCHSETTEGERFNDQEVIDHMIFLMMAAHDTTNITMNTMFYRLAKHPDWQQRCREEASQYADTPPTMQDLPEMNTLGLVMKESLRLVPPLPVLPRQAIRDIEYKGVTIRRGNLVQVLPAFTHHMDTLWDDPTAFDPLRFSPERAEDKRHKFGYIPFGGGVHKCIGLHFADLQVKAVMTQILNRYEWTVPSKYKVKWENTSLPKPKDDLPVVMKRI